MNQESVLHVVMFTGGRGTQSITQALLAYPHIQLTLLVNAYDDGLSTGAVRAWMPGMLGPSDIRKNICHLIQETEGPQRALKAILEYRFPEATSREKAESVLSAIAGSATHVPAAELDVHYRELTLRQVEPLARWARATLAYAQKQREAQREFPYGDCSLGNLLFAGCYLESGKDFNRAVASMGDVCGLRGTVLNITSGENLVLSALKVDGAIMYDEAEIVSAQEPTPIQELFLLSSYLKRAEWDGLSLEQKKSRLVPLDRVPEVNPAAETALAQADMIIYGPGTQHSSLFPSYMTRGVGEAIAGNSKAEKIYIGNVLRDQEIQMETAASLFRKFLFYLNRKGKLAIPWDKLVTQFFLQNPATETMVHSNYVPLVSGTFPFPNERVMIADWEHGEGKHSGPRVVDEIVAIVNTRLQKKLKPFHHTVSIVVPALNEQKTIEKVLHELQLLNFGPLGLGKEIVFVDGGSTDGTYELAQQFQSVRRYRLERPLGRGAAMRLGIEKATGDIIAFFSSDDEYRPADLIPVVQGIANDFRAVYGSRAIKCINVNQRIRDIYRGNYFMYLVSKYGGLLVSAWGALLYNRFISDVFTGIKAFDARLLRDLHLKADGFEIESEFLGKLGKQAVFILEVPVEYRPRTRAEGKKTTVWDGLRALAYLLTFPLRRA